MDTAAGIYEKTPKRVFSYMSPWFDFFTASAAGQCELEQNGSPGAGKYAGPAYFAKLAANRRTRIAQDARDGHCPTRGSRVARGRSRGNVDAGGRLIPDHFTLPAVPL